MSSDVPQLPLHSQAATDGARRVCAGHIGVALRSLISAHITAQSLGGAVDPGTVEAMGRLVSDAQEITRTLAPPGGWPEWASLEQAQAINGVAPLPQAVVEAGVGGGHELEHDRVHLFATMVGDLCRAHGFGVHTNRSLVDWLDHKLSGGGLD